MPRAQSLALIATAVIAALAPGLARAASSGAPPISASSAATAASVGYQQLSIDDPEGPPILIAIWYPAQGAAGPTPVGPFVQSLAPDAPVSGQGLGLIVMSHGHGGSFSSHADTALALAQAGFVVAALEHTGDNYHDQSRATDMANRPRQLKLLVDYMLQGWSGRAQIDPARIGAFGFSSGGFTVLAAAGGQPDFTLFGPHCRAHPDAYDCRLTAQSPSPDLTHAVWTHDARLKAIVCAAPALGFTFRHGGLDHVTAPIQLWRAADDHILPQPDYAEAVRASLPTAPDDHVVAKAGHFDFLAPCSAVLNAAAPDICASAPGFDRAAFHADFNRAVTAFFQARLGGEAVRDARLQLMVQPFASTAPSFETIRSYNSKSAW